MTQLEELRAMLSPPKVIQRKNDFEFVNCYTNSSYYFSKCFPILFPYGRGCPSDRDTKLSDMSLHSQKMLKRGGGPNPRRFQQTPNYYFTVYSYLMKQKIGGIATLAQKRNLDGTALPEDLPTVGEINDLLDYLGDTTSADEVERIQSESKSDGQSTYDMDKIKKLISRLVPYSRHAQGTEMGIRYEILMELDDGPITWAERKHLVSSRIQFYHTRVVQQ
jgi:hypothetical protein